MYSYDVPASPRRSTTASRPIPGMRPSYDAEHPHSATPIYDELYSEYRRLFRALPGDRSGEEDLAFTGFAVRDTAPARTDPRPYPPQHQAFQTYAGQAVGIPQFMPSRPGGADQPGQPDQPFGHTGHTGHPHDPFGAAGTGHPAGPYPAGFPATPAPGRPAGGHPGGAPSAAPAGSQAGNGQGWVAAGYLGPVPPPVPAPAPVTVPVPAPAPAVGAPRPAPPPRPRRAGGGPPGAGTPPH
ncbi:hypothetical protein, partial [Kitasatospora sp. NPDC001527]|uniref:hypothetical protein n=1 Tax=Kitasatospora sp. NPDC001527 TaxID=3154519 RepID=UPI00331B9D34